MKHLVTASALCTMLTLSACGGSPQSSAPPLPVDALTIEPVAASSAPDQTDSDASTQRTSSDGATSPGHAGDLARTTSAPDAFGRTASPSPSSTPTLPTDAARQSEDGAAAFVVHYFDLVSYLGQFPEAGVIDGLAASGCAACSNYEENIDYLITHDAVASGPSLEVGKPKASVAEDAALVTIPLTQKAYANVNATGREINAFEPAATRRASVELRWADGAWLVQRISTSAN